jgi:hypothetical protein
MSSGKDAAHLASYVEKFAAERAWSASKAYERSPKKSRFAIQVTRRRWTMKLWSARCPFWLERTSIEGFG